MKQSRWTIKYRLSGFNPKLHRTTTERPVSDFNRVLNGQKNCHEFFSRDLNKFSRPSRHLGVEKQWLRFGGTTGQRTSSFKQKTLAHAIQLLTVTYTDYIVRKNANPCKEVTICLCRKMLVGRMWVQIRAPPKELLSHSIHFSVIARVPWCRISTLYKCEWDNVSSVL